MSREQDAEATAEDVGMSREQDAEATAEVPAGCRYVETVGNEIRLPSG